MNTQAMPWFLDSIAEKPPAIVNSFLFMDIVLCLAYLANSMVGSPSHAVTVFLDLGGERSLASWFSSIQYFFIFLLCAFFSYSKIKADNKSLPLICLPLIFLLMSIDESVQIHEWLGEQVDILFIGRSGRSSTALPLTGVWMFAIGIPFIILFKHYADSIRHHFHKNQPAFKKLLWGMAIMLSGAIGLETIVNFVDHEFLFVEIALEECLEMIGATVMLWAAYDLALHSLTENPDILSKQT